MRAVRFFVSAFVGFVLYQLTVLANGILAAVQIPAAYFHFFGPQHIEFGHALLGIGMHMPPSILLVAGGVLATERLWPTRHYLKWFPYFLGMLACLLLWELVLSPSLAGSLRSQDSVVPAAFQSFFAIPWWAVPVVAGPWLGLGLAAWLLSRRCNAQVRSAA